MTQALRALNELHAGAFVFKGGTSLSKGYGLIERFSEDVDILVTPHSGDSAKTREGLLQSMSAAVAEKLGVELLQARTPGRGRHPHRADVLVYPRVVTSSITMPIEDRGVLLETGYAGGEWPAEMVTITPLLNAPLGLGAGDYEDTDPLEMRALLPARTLLEKVSLLHHLATTWTPQATTAQQRCGRHYYDIHQLLEHGPTRTVLEDRAQFKVIVAEMERVSERHFGGWSPRPEDGFAAGPAFCPPEASELRGWLANSYGDSAGLLPARASGGWPSFNAVLRRIERHAHLL